MLNMPEFEKLFQQNFGGNYHKAAREIGDDAGQIHRIINGKQKAGLLFIERLLLWCSDNNVDYAGLIFLPDMLIKRNEPS